MGVGDIVTEPFITLKDASVHCNVDNEACTISMRWGDKIPYEKAVLVRAVGNSSNAAVAASRLGLQSALVTNIGDDDIGKGNIQQLKSEKVQTKYVQVHRGMKSNYHYVLSYQSERTILIKHEEYPYKWPNPAPPRFMYFSSLASNSLPYHREVEAYLVKYPDIFLAFQPGTFEIKLGAKELKRFYERANILFINKEEAERILGIAEDGNHISDLLTRMHELGPKVVVITDGRNGAYSYDGNEKLFIPMYPDHRPPVERTGAGDAFASTITAALALGKPLREALLWGPINAMAVVQEIGAQKGLLYRKDIEQYLASAPPEYAVRAL